MSTGPSGGGRAGHEQDRDYVDKDVTETETEPVEREGDYVDRDVERAVPTAGREGEYTDKEVGPDDTDPPKGSYTDRDVQR